MAPFPHKTSLLNVISFHWKYNLFEAFLHRRIRGHITPNGFWLTILGQDFGEFRGSLRVPARGNDFVASGD